jgi:hypothetical protein
VLSRDDALVLFEWLNRMDAKRHDLRDIVDDPAEQRALWNLICLLERELSEPFTAAYRDAVDEARRRLRDDG